MSRWSPCKRRECVRRLRALGFDGPFSGTRHQFMTFGSHRLTIPSNEEFSAPQLRFMLAGGGGHYRASTVCGRLECFVVRAGRVMANRHP